MESGERLADIIVSADGGQEPEGRNRPTIFGSLTPPTGDEVRQYYAKRFATRGTILRRTAIHAIATLRGWLQRAA